MPSSEAPNRHDLVWLAADWRDGLRSPTAAAEIALLGAWIGAGRPLIAARPTPCDAGGGLRLGYALPGKRRLGIVVDAAVVARIGPPPTLGAVTATAPAALRVPLARLERHLAEHGIAARVFGSFAWHGLAAVDDGHDPGYLSPSSDIDLLIAAAGPAEAAAICDRLTDHASRHPAPRLDGEIVFPNGGAVAWREFAERPATVLVKTRLGADLRAWAEVAEPVAEVVR